MKLKKDEFRDMVSLEAVSWPAKSQGKNFTLSSRVEAIVSSLEF
jgi:hypothetical protein